MNNSLFNIFAESLVTVFSSKMTACGLANTGIVMESIFEIITLL